MSGLIWDDRASAVPGGSSGAWEILSTFLAHRGARGTRCCEQPEAWPKTSMKISLPRATTKRGDGTVHRSQRVSNRALDAPKRVLVRVRL